MITRAVKVNPYFSPEYEYAIAKMIGAYIPCVFVPNIYLAMLTIVASIQMATKMVSVSSCIPLFSSHWVISEYCMVILLTSYFVYFYWQICIIILRKRRVVDMFMGSDPIHEIIEMLVWKGLGLTV